MATEASPLEQLREQLRAAGATSAELAALHYAADAAARAAGDEIERLQRKRHSALIDASAAELAALDERLERLEREKPDLWAIAKELERRRRDAERAERFAAVPAQVEQLKPLVERIGHLSRKLRDAEGELRGVANLLEQSFTEAQRAGQLHTLPVVGQQLIDAVDAILAGPPVWGDTQPRRVFNLPRAPEDQPYLVHNVRTGETEARGGWTDERLDRAGGVGAIEAEGV